MKLRAWVFVLFLMALPLSANAQLFPMKMVQCESCSDATQMKQVTRARGEGSWVVFSVAHGIINRYAVIYDPDVKKDWLIVRGNLPAGMKDAFQLMLHEDQLGPRLVSGVTQVVVT